MKIVLARGCFDLLHVAHVRHLEQARSFGDFLAVGLTTDRAITRWEKGAGRPIISEDERMEMLRSLHCVSAVSLCDTWQEAMNQWRPHIFAKGADQKDKLPSALVEYCAKHGITIMHTDPNPQTTSGIIERIKSGQPVDVCPDCGEKLLFISSHECTAGYV